MKEKAKELLKQLLLEKGYRLGNKIQAQVNLAIELVAEMYGADPAQLKKRFKDIEGFAYAPGVFEIKSWAESREIHATLIDKLFNDLL